MSKCESCMNFYTCDNMGWFEECQQENYQYYEEREDEEVEEEKGE